jgi:glycosyltransferase involved in cell wall biosynthesis
MTDQSPEAPICLAIPFFSGLDYLSLALRSLIEQTDPAWTAIVVDDASPEDGAEAVVGELGDPRVRYVRNDYNLGVAANFNRCIDLAAAEAPAVVVFHGDDELAPGYVAAIRAAHRSFPDATCVAPRVTVIDGHGRPARTIADTVKAMLWPRHLPVVLEGDEGLAKLMRGLFFYCPSVSYRVDLLPKVRFDTRWRQVMDLDLYSRVLLDGGSIVVFLDRTYRYRRHEATMTAANSRSLVRLDEETQVCREVAAMARDRGWRRSVRAAQLRGTVRLNGLLEALRLAARRQLRLAWRATRQSVV